MVSQTTNMVPVVISTIFEMGTGRSERRFALVGVYARCVHPSLLNFVERGRWTNQDHRTSSSSYFWWQLACPARKILSKSNDDPIRDSCQWPLDQCCKYLKPSRIGVRPCWWTSSGPSMHHWSTWVGIGRRQTIALIARLWSRPKLIEDCNDDRCTVVGETEVG